MKRLIALLINTLLFTQITVIPPTANTSAVVTETQDINYAYMGINPNAVSDSISVSAEGEDSFITALKKYAETPRDDFGVTRIMPYANYNMPLIFEQKTLYLPVLPQGYKVEKMELIGASTPYLAFDCTSTSKDTVKILFFVNKGYTRNYKPKGVYPNDYGYKVFANEYGGAYFTVDGYYVYITYTKSTKELCKLISFKKEKLSLEIPPKPKEMPKTEILRRENELRKRGYLLTQNDFERRLAGFVSNDNDPYRKATGMWGEAKRNYSKLFDSGLYSIPVVPKEYTLSFVCITPKEMQFYYYKGENRFSYDYATPRNDLMISVSDSGNKVVPSENLSDNEAQALNKKVSYSTQYVNELLKKTPAPNEPKSLECGTHPVLAMYGCTQGAGGVIDLKYYDMAASYTLNSSRFAVRAQLIAPTNKSELVDFNTRKPLDSNIDLQNIYKFKVTEKILDWFGNTNLNNFIYVETGYEITKGEYLLFLDMNNELRHQSGDKVYSTAERKNAFGLGLSVFHVSADHKLAPVDKDSVWKANDYSLEWFLAQGKKKVITKELLSKIKSDMTFYDVYRLLGITKSSVTDEYLSDIPQFRVSFQFEYNVEESMPYNLYTSNSVYDKLVYSKIGRNGAEIVSELTSLREKQKSAGVCFDFNGNKVIIRDYDQYIKALSLSSTDVIQARFTGENTTAGVGWVSDNGFSYIIADGLVSLYEFEIVKSYKGNLKKGDKIKVSLNYIMSSDFSPREKDLNFDRNADFLLMIKPASESRLGYEVVHDIYSYNPYIFQIEEGDLLTPIPKGVWNETGFTLNRFCKNIAK